jgi:PAS domain S-box-containing protein
LPNATFDHLVALVADQLEMPTAFLSLIDEDHQWFLSRYGLDLIRTTRAVSFCSHTILGTGPLVVTDATRDERFRNSPLVKDEPRIRFYAGTPLRTSDGHAIGTLSVIDRQPHQDFGPEKMRMLQRIAEAVMSILEGHRSAIEALDRKERFLQGVLDSLIAFVAVLTPEGTVTYANRLCFEISGVRPDMVLGRHLADSYWFAYSQEISTRIRDAVDRAREGGHSRFDIRSRHTDGSFLDIEFSLAPMHGDGERHLIASAIDITARKRSEAVLRESEERFRNMADHAPVIIWVSEVDGSCSYLSQRWTDLTGQTLEEGLDFGWLERVHPDDRAHARTVILDANSRQAPYRLDYRLRRADGRHAWVIDTAAPRFTPNGRFLGYIGSVIDISERKTMEEAMRASEERLRVTMNAVPVLVWVCDPQGLAIRFNERWHEYTGFTLEQSVGEGWTRALHPEDVDRAQDVWNDVRARGASYEVELRYRNRSGAYRWMLARAEPVRDAAGAVVEWIGSSIDIHDLRTTENTLRRALDDKDMLLREVHHRVKNNLQAVWALIQLESLRLKNNPEGRERLQAIGERLDVLGRLHQQLYRSEDLARVALAPYLEQLTLSLVNLHDQSDRVSVEVEAEPLTCDLDTALPLGLAVNELVTNSLKHAFPAGRRGTIHLDLRRLRGGAVELVVSDDGVGASPPSVSQGIGMVVVQSLIGQLDADWSIEADRGMRARLVLPGARFRAPRTGRKPSGRAQGDEQ